MQNLTNATVRVPYSTSNGVQKVNVEFSVRTKVIVGQDSVAVQLEASAIASSMGPMVSAVIGMGDLCQPSLIGRRSSRKKICTNLPKNIVSFAVENHYGMVSHCFGASPVVAFPMTER